MSTRQSLIDYLAPKLEAVEGLERVKFVPTIRATDALSSQPILILKTNAIVPLPSAPRHYAGEFTLVLVSNLTDPEAAEDQLDGLLELLMPALFDNAVMWTRAEQTAYDDTHLSYDITLNTILS